MPLVLLPPPPPCRRVLIFLEALALGRPPPAFGVHLLPQLLAAAQHLGLRNLEVGAGGVGERADEPCRWVGGSARLWFEQPCPSLGRAPHRERAPGSCPPQEHCQERLGDSTARLRLYRFDEVRALNAAGGCWLILDGMVLDVTRCVLLGDDAASAAAK